MTLPPLVEVLSEDWLLFLTAGITVGGVLNVLVPRKSYGIFPDCFAGLAGSVTGGCLAWVWNDYFRPGGFTLILSFFCAVVFIAVLRKVNRKVV